jgi:UDP-N-acetylglucosamine acyltransferase
MPIHPSAIVDPGAKIAASVEIGPYVVIGPNVCIGERTVIKSHVCLEGPLTIGPDNIFYPHSSIGIAPQVLNYKGEASEARIGARNQIREFVTINRGTEGGGMLTEIGDDNLLMALAHVAHDTKIQNHTVIGHAATLGGHVLVEDWAIISAGSAVHQFCRIGKHAFVGGYTVITQDVLPYSTTVAPREVKVFGANATGLERRNFSPETIDSLHKTFRLLTRSGLNTSQAVERILSEVPHGPEIEEILDFIASSERGFTK